MPDIATKYVTAVQGNSDFQWVEVDFGFDRYLAVKEKPETYGVVWPLKLYMQLSDDPETEGYSIVMVKIREETGPKRECFDFASLLSSANVSQRIIIEVAGGSGALSCVIFDEVMEVQQDMNLNADLNVSKSDPPL